jgi:hypothetical protein
VKAGPDFAGYGSILRREQRFPQGEGREISPYFSLIYGLPETV